MTGYAWPVLAELKTEERPLPPETPTVRYDTPLDFPLILGRGFSQGTALAELLAPSSVLVMGFLYFFYVIWPWICVKSAIQAQNNWLIKT